MLHSKFSSFIWIKLRYVTYSESSIKSFRHKMTEVFPSPPGTARPFHTSEGLLKATAGLGLFPQHPWRSLFLSWRVWRKKGEHNRGIPDFEGRTVAMSQLETRS